MGQEIRLKGGGRLTLSEEGMLVRLEAVCPDDEQGLYKVWIWGNGGRMLLGTLVPEGGKLRLCRRISRSELERSGCWPVVGGETVLAFSFAPPCWQREEYPDKLVKDVVLQRSLRGCGMLLRRQKSGFCLAAEYHPGRPFPLPALFCLCRVEWVERNLCAIFCFDRAGNPIVPHNDCDGGENSGTS